MVCDDDDIVILVEKCEVRDGVLKERKGLGMGLRLRGCLVEEKGRENLVGKVELGLSLRHMVISGIRERRVESRWLS